MSHEERLRSIESKLDDLHAGIMRLEVLLMHRKICAGDSNSNLDPDEIRELSKEVQRAQSAAMVALRMGR